MTETSENIVQTTIRVPKDLKHQWKVASAQAELSMDEWAQRAIERTLADATATRVRSERFGEMTEREERHVKTLLRVLRAPREDKLARIILDAITAWGEGSGKAHSQTD